MTSPLLICFSWSPLSFSDLAHCRSSVNGDWCWYGNYLEESMAWGVQKLGFSVWVPSWPVQVISVICFSVSELQRESLSHLLTQGFLTVTLWEGSPSYRAGHGGLCSRSPTGSTCINTTHTRTEMWGMSLISGPLYITCILCFLVFWYNTVSAS